MTPEQIRTIKETWQLVLPLGDTAAALFYERLFAIDPSARPLFPPERLPGQRRKLMHVLDTTVRGLDQLDELVPVVEDLGRRHAGFGVTEGHYGSRRRRLAVDARARPRGRLDAASRGCLA